LILLLSMASLCAPALHAGLVVDLTGGTTSACNVGCGVGTTFGWSFTVTSPIAIDGIGMWDTLPNGVGLAIGAGLYTSSGALVQSVTVTDSSTPVASANPDGRWLFEYFRSSPSRRATTSSAASSPTRIRPLWLVALL
jgi:hypothetical protein